MRRRVVLHLLAGHEVVLAGASRRTAQAGLPDPSGQRAVVHVEAVVSQQLADAHHIAAGALEGRLHPQQRRFVTRWRLGSVASRLTQDTPHRVARQRQEAADLAQAVPLGL